MADILEGDLPNVDILDMLALLKPFMPGPDLEALALSFDMCPIHNQDLDSCADDDTDEIKPVNYGCGGMEGMGGEAEMRPLNTPVLAACRHLRARTGE